MIPARGVFRLGYISAVVVPDPVAVLGELVQERTVWRLQKRGGQFQQLVRSDESRQEGFRLRASQKLIVVILEVLHEVRCGE